MLIFTARFSRKYVLNNNKMLLQECRSNYYVNFILAVCMWLSCFKRYKMEMCLICLNVVRNNTHFIEYNGNWKTYQAYDCNFF